MQKGDKVKIVSQGGGNCPEVGSVGIVVICTMLSALVDFSGVEVWCRYSEIRAYSEMDAFLSEWNVGENHG